MKNPIIKNGLVLALFAMLCTGLVAFIDKATEQKIEQQKQAQRLKVLSQIVPSSIHDNKLTASCTLISAPNVLGTDEAQQAFIAKKDGKATAIAIETIAPDGYNGKIKLVMAVNEQGRLLGVRTLTHNETPGLGDKIELTKSDWVLSFVNKYISNNNRKTWKVKKDGGAFDQFTGATITPRAYVKSVYKTLDYVIQHFDQIVHSTSSCEENHG
ncbi:MAG: electron transport complex subunit RsxG [Parashewanella sp.]